MEQAVKDLKTSMFRVERRNKIHNKKNCQLKSSVYEVRTGGYE